MDSEIAIPRARAAWAYARLSQQELAKSTGLSYDRVRALLGSTRLGREPAAEELWKIADACGVPRSFMDHGFVDGEHSVRLLTEELMHDPAAARQLAALIAPHVSEIAAGAQPAAPGPATPKQREAVRRLGGAGSRPATTDQRSQRPGRP